MNPLANTQSRLSVVTGYSPTEISSASPAYEDGTYRQVYAIDFSTTLRIYRTLSYSFFASIRIGRSGSAPFHSAKKSWYDLRALARSPWITAARASQRCAGT